MPNEVVEGDTQLLEENVPGGRKSKHMQMSWGRAYLVNNQSTDEATETRMDRIHLSGGMWGQEDLHLA